MSKTECDVFIFTVISEEYVKLALVWGLQVQKKTGRDPHFICVDDESFAFLTSWGFPCTLKSPTALDLDLLSKQYQELHFDNAKAIYIISLKQIVACHYLKAGYDVLYSDVDAIWVENPLEDLKSNGADFLFQPGSFPDQVKKQWGFSICTGFFYMRSCPQTIKLSELANQGFDGDDQRTLNDVLVREFEILWEEKPYNWENCSLEDGWTWPLSGTCTKTNLKAVALPHSLYQRHGTQNETCGHAIICHPNSPKDQAKKFEVFAALGMFSEADVPSLPEDATRHSTLENSHPKKYTHFMKRIKEFVRAWRG